MRYILIVCSITICCCNNNEGKLAGSRWKLISMKKDMVNRIDTSDITVDIFTDNKPDVQLQFLNESQLAILIDSSSNKTINYKAFNKSIFLHDTESAYKDTLHIIKHTKRELELHGIKGITYVLHSVAN